MRITTILLCSLISIPAWGIDDPDFDETARILTIPRGTSDKKNVFHNVQILLNLDSTWEILAIELEPENFFTGNWGGSLTEAPLITFGVPLPSQQLCDARTEISLIQNENKLTGTGVLFGDCIEGGRGSITGVINGNNISFEINSDIDSKVFNYSGTISSTHDTLTLAGPTANADIGQSEWILTLQ